MSHRKPKIIPKHEHNIVEADISKNALRVLARLNEFGFDAYLVGGGVRDLLLGLSPKDFDIVTNAHPEQVKKIFRNCRIIGKRFRLAHVFFGSEIIEVATFRTESNNISLRAKSTSGMILRDNVYGTMEDDVWRRDFTINALYYNYQDSSIVDYVGGMDDIQGKLVRIIGSAKLRYHEDPMRMLRAVRIAAKVGFRVDHETAECLSNLMGLLQNVAPARLFDEVVKWFVGGKSLVTYEMCRNYGLFATLFPQTEARLVGENSEFTKAFIWHGFHNTDKRIAEYKSLNPAFLFAVLLWPSFQHQIDKFLVEGMKFGEAFPKAMTCVMKYQKNHLAIPARLILTIEEIWLLQYRLLERRNNKINHIFMHKKFRAAYDFLELRAKAGDDVASCVKWWEEYQKKNVRKGDEVEDFSLNETLNYKNKKKPGFAKRRSSKSKLKNSLKTTDELLSGGNVADEMETAPDDFESRNNIDSYIELLSDHRSWRN